MGDGTGWNGLVGGEWRFLFASGFAVGVALVLLGFAFLDAASPMGFLDSTRSLVVLAGVALAGLLGLALYARGRSLRETVPTDRFDWDE